MTKNADPQMFFSRNEKKLQNSFGLWARQNTNESKENLRKDFIRVPILFTSTDLQRYLGQRKVSTFQCENNEVFFDEAKSYSMYEMASMLTVEVPSYSEELF